MADSLLDDLAAADADPSAARSTLANLSGVTDLLRRDERLARRVVTVAAASNGLGRLLVEDESAIDVLADLDDVVVLRSGDPASLARSFRLRFLQIAAADLVGGQPLDDITEALSRLADGVLDAAVDLAEVEGLAVVAMGKAGADELNFVSDVDVMFVGEGDPVALQRAARSVLTIAGRCFTVDANLRPEGRDGALVRSVDGFEAYWHRWARPWEFQALLKARPAAGCEEIGERFAIAAASSLWDRPFTHDDLVDIRRLKRRVEAEVAARGLAEREVKRGTGGIRDIEFSVQLLQLVHGRADATLRVRSTRRALAELANGEYVDADEADLLDRAYVLFRRVEHALQLVDLRRTHTVPDDRGARRRIARTLGYRGQEDGGPTERFDQDLAFHRVSVRRVHDGWYFRPLLSAFAGAGTISRVASDARLAAFGFREAERTRQAVAELTKGLTRTSRLMRQLLPLLLGWLSESPDPDAGLLGLRRLASGETRTTTLVEVFHDSAEVARNLCHLVGSSPLAIEILETNPDLLERLDAPSRLTTSPPDDLAHALERTVGWRHGARERQRAMRRWWRRNLFGVVARDLLGEADVAEVGADLAVLAEAVLGQALRLADPQVPLAIIGLGRFGGRELSYRSDVDLVVVYDGAGDADRAEASRVASAVFGLLQGATPAARILAVDPDLRPEGRQGPLARTLDSYNVYLERWGETWERQALLRARPVGGDASVGRAFTGLVEHHLWSRSRGDDVVREVRRMKARIERERAPSGRDARNDLKLGPGGIVDVEFTVQLAQWQAGVRQQATLAALARLVELGAIDPDDAAILHDAHRFCDEVRNRATLLGVGGDRLPTRPDRMLVLARSLDTSPAELLERHRRVTRRCRAVVERRFYGTA